MRGIIDVFNDYVWFTKNQSENCADRLVANLFYLIYGEMSDLKRDKNTFLFANKSNNKELISSNYAAVSDSIETVLLSTFNSVIQKISILPIKNISSGSSISLSSDSGFVFNVFDNRGSCNGVVIVKSLNEDLFRLLSNKSFDGVLVTKVEKSNSMDAIMVVNSKYDHDFDIHSIKPSGSAHSLNIKMIVNGEPMSSKLVIGEKSFCSEMMAMSEQIAKKISKRNLGAKISSLSVKNERESALEHTI